MPEQLTTGAPGASAGVPPGGRVAADGSPLPSLGLTDADFGDDRGSDGAAGGKPAEYKAELPADLKLPEGVSFKFDDRDAVHGEILVEAEFRT